MLKGKELTFVADQAEKQECLAFAISDREAQLNTWAQILSWIVTMVQYPPIPITELPQSQHNWPPKRISSRLEEHKAAVKPSLSPSVPTALPSLLRYGKECLVKALREKVIPWSMIIA